MILVASCAGEDVTGDADTDVTACDGDPCSTRLGVTLDDVTVDGSAGGTSVSFGATLDNPTSSPARILGWVLECRYLVPDASMLRGSGTMDSTVQACSGGSVSDPGFTPGVLHWEGAPTGDDIICILDLIYSYEGCTTPPPQVRVTVTGSDAIIVHAP